MKSAAAIALLAIATGAIVTGIVTSGDHASLIRIHAALGIAAVSLVCFNRALGWRVILLVLMPGVLECLLRNQTVPTVIVHACLAPVFFSICVAIAMKRDAAGNFLFVITASPQLLVYSMQPGSTSLTQVTSLTLTKAPTDLSVITFTPAGSSSTQEFLYVANNFDYCTGITCNPQHNDNTVSAYTVGSTGTLTEQTNSPYAIAATDPISLIAVNTNPPGQNTGGVFVYVGNQDPNGGHVYPFQVCTVVGNNACTQSDVQNSLMVPLATCPQISCDVPPTNAGQQPVAMLVDPTNNFLYVLSEGSNTLYGFRINTTAGTLTALTPASEPTGSQPVALALQTPVGSSAQFIYVSNSTSSNISGFNVSTTTGSMSSPITVVSPSNPSGMVAR